MRKFVTEQEQPELVESAAQIFLRTQGSIRATVGHILERGLEDPGTKIKRPTDFIAGAIRSLGADTDGGQPLPNLLGSDGPTSISVADTRRAARQFNLLDQQSDAPLALRCGILPKSD